MKDNAYRDQVEFVEGEKWALALGRGLYDRFIDDAVRWGIETYEPDWLMHTFWDIPWLRSGWDHAEQWMRWQHDAAAERGLTLQLTMAGSPHLMMTVDLPAVTTFRTSIDYHADVSKESFWPMFHTVNMLAGALGVWPFKDNFHSGEDHGAQEALVSVLSGGMVGPGDALGTSDVALLQSTCRSDGVLLKPDRPATPIDAMFLPHARPYVTHTWSEVPGVGRWTYVAAYHLARSHPERDGLDETFALFSYNGRDLNDLFVWPDAVTDWRLDPAADLGLEGPRVAWDMRGRTATVVQGAFELPATPHLYDHAHVVLAPIFDNGLALLGETGKLVPVAARRFTRIAPTADGIALTVAGAPGEAVVVEAYDAEVGALLPPLTLTVGADGTAAGVLGR